MKLQLPGDVTIEIETDGTESASDLVERIVAHESMDAVLAAVAADTGWERWERWDSIEDSTVRAIASAFLEGGRDAASDAISDFVQDSPETGAEAYVDNVARSCGLLAKTIAAVKEAVHEIDEDADDDEVVEEFLDGIRETLAEKMVEADRSEPLSVVPSHARVELVEILAPAGVDAEECSIGNVGVVFGLGTAIPGDGLRGLFERLNVPFAGFVDHVAAKTGVHLDAGRRNAALVDWLAEADYVGGREAAREQALERADAWASFEPAYDPDRPSVSTFEDVATMLDNASYGGHPVFVCRLPLHRLLERDWSVASVSKADERYGGRSGGFVGIYEAGGGSGYLESPRAPVQIPSGTERMRVSGKWGYAVDDVFGMVGSGYHADAFDDPNPVPAPEHDVAPCL